LTSSVQCLSLMGGIVTTCVVVCGDHHSDSAWGI